MTVTCVAAPALVGQDERGSRAKFLRGTTRGSPTEIGSPDHECPYCRVDNDRVTDWRASEDGFAIRRRRECVHCRRRYTTYERIEEQAIKVVKKDGGRVPYEREKIKGGLEKACWKRPISDEQIEAVVSAIEATFTPISNPRSKAGIWASWPCSICEAGTGGVRAICQRLSRL